MEGCRLEVLETRAYAIIALDLLIKSGEINTTNIKDLLRQFDAEISKFQDMLNEEEAEEMYFHLMFTDDLAWNTKRYPMKV